MTTPSSIPPAASLPPVTDEITVGDNPRPRKLVAIDANGREMTGLGGINFTGIVNDSAAAPITVSLQRQCDLGHWHETDSMVAPLWDQS